MDVTASYYIPGQLGFDLFPGAPMFLSDEGGVTLDEDRDIDTERQVEVGEEFSTVIRLLATKDLLGLTLDFCFDKDVLEITDIRETRMDLDFSGLQDQREMKAIREFYESGDRVVDDFTYTYNDGTGEISTSPGVLIDFDGDGELSPYEFALYETEYKANRAGTDIPFWTEAVARRGGFNESVEIFDTIADINTTGCGTDNTTVLLRRPETPAQGFGFDGDAILFEVRFRAIAKGDSQIALENVSGIRETFMDIVTDVYPIETVLSPSLVHVAQPQDARMLLGTIERGESPRAGFQDLLELVQTWMR